MSPNYVGLPAGYRMNDYVDIGGAEGGHGIVQGGPNGWGPIEPATSGGSWGGGTDTARVVWEPGGDRSGSLTLDFGAQQGVDKFLALRWLDGLADDSFEFTVADAFGHVSGGWLNNGSAGHPEAWFDLVSWNVGEMWGVSTVTITATGPQWALWGTYGQVAFSEAAAYTVPSPAAALLITLGLGLAGWVKRRIS